MGDAMIPWRETPLLVGGWRRGEGGKLVHWVRYLDPRFQREALERKLALMIGAMEWVYPNGGAQ